MIVTTHIAAEVETAVGGGCVVEDNNLLDGWDD